MKIGVFGIGLIGGSLSIQARKHFTDSKIYGFDLSNKNLNRALKLGLIDAILDSNEIKNLNIIFTNPNFINFIIKFFFYKNDFSRRHFNLMC